MKLFRKLSILMCMWRHPLLLARSLIEKLMNKTLRKLIGSSPGVDERYLVRVCWSSLSSSSSSLAQWDVCAEIFFFANFFCSHSTSSLLFHSDASTRFSFLSKEFLNFSIPMFPSCKQHGECLRIKQTKIFSIWNRQSHRVSWAFRLFSRRQFKSLSRVDWMNNLFYVVWKLFYFRFHFTEKRRKVCASAIYSHVFFGSMNQCTLLLGLRLHPCWCLLLHSWRGGKRKFQEDRKNVFISARIKVEGTYRVYTAKSIEEKEEGRNSMEIVIINNLYVNSQFASLIGISLRSF